MDNLRSLCLPRNLYLPGIVLLLLVAAVMLPGPGQADPGNLFVSTAGSGANCSQADPCDLATALQQAQDTDIIYLAAGIYTASGEAVVSITQDISLYGGWDGAADGSIHRDPILHQTILDGQDARRVVVISTGAAPVLDGLTIRDGYGDYSGGGIKSEVSHPTIQNCILEQNHADGDGGAIFINGGSAQILGNQILNNSANWSGGLRIINNPQVTLKGNQISGNTANISAGGVDIDCCGGTVVKVEENIITGNSAGAYGGGVVVASTNAALVNNIIAANSAPEGAGIYLDGAETFPVEASLTNNTLVGTTSGDHAVWLDEYSTAVLTNNILSNFSIGIHDNSPLNNVLTADYNLFFNTSDPLLGTNATQADPLLDVIFHLTWGSPAINSGIVVQNSIDIDGDPRPNGSFDLGADEYFPTLYLPFLISSASSP